MIACKRFYPSGCHTAEARLRHYALTFPFVEVDSAYYSVPDPSTAATCITGFPAAAEFRHSSWFGTPSSMGRRGSPTAYRQVIFNNNTQDQGQRSALTLMDLLGLQYSPPSLPADQLSLAGM